MNLEWSQYQLDIFRAVADTGESLLIEAVAGCLTGDTIIGLNRAGRGFRMSLRDVVHRFNGGLAGTKIWRSDIPTYIRAPHPDGTVRLSLLTAALTSGMKPVSRLILKSGKSIEATSCHRFMTPDGWKRLDELAPRSIVIVEASSKGPGQGKSPKRNYLKRCVPFHPNAVNSGMGKLSVPTHRLHVEAHMNGMDLEQFVWTLQTSAEGIKFLDTGLEVHHKDRNHWNNGLSNLEVVTISEHKILHSEENVNNVQTHLREDTVTKIASAGKEMTYDLTVPGVDSFIANGIAVHNSGKTSTIVEAINYVPAGKTVCFVAFNKSIADELQRRVTHPGARCMTLHSAGWQAWKRSLGWDENLCKVETNKTFNVMKELMTWKEREKWGETTRRLVGYGKQMGIVPESVEINAHDWENDKGEILIFRGLVDDTDQAWESLCDHYGIDFDEVNLGMVRKVLARGIETSREQCDFDDMLYMPVVAGVEFDKWDVVFVDEAQDLSGIQIEMIERMVRP